MMVMMHNDFGDEGSDDDDGDCDDEIPFLT